MMPNPIYEMYNQQYIQQNAQHHAQQTFEVMKCTRAFEDFLDSVDKITDPQYQQLASQQLCSILLAHICKHN